jgi:8-amino-7-oxononanoate synthase
MSPRSEPTRRHLQRYRQRLSHLEEAGRLRTERTVDSFPDGTCEIQGRQLVNFGGNDYLNLAHEVWQCPDFQAVVNQQLGATASALVSGRSRWHGALEAELAVFEGTESALLFPTGYAANLGVLSGLVEKGDAVFCDRDNHASIIDACQSCDGRMLVYRRDRLEALSQSLQRRQGEYERLYVVTDGVYSMDGNIASLQQLCDVAERFGAAVIVDEAHGTGVLGDYGRGASDFCNVEERVLVRIGTMSKAMGGLGGFAVADRTTIALLRNTARTQFFSTALPPAICAAMRESLRVIRSQPERRYRLAELTLFAHREIEILELKSVGVGVAPIIPILPPNGISAVALSGRLSEAGFFVPAIRPPTVPDGTDRLRMSLTVQHTFEQIRAALQIVSAVSQQK